MGVDVLYHSIGSFVSDSCSRSALPTAAAELMRMLRFISLLVLLGSVGCGSRIHTLHADTAVLSLTSPVAAGIRLVEIQRDGTTTVEFTDAHNRFTAKPGGYFDTVQSESTSLFLVSSSFEQQTAKITRRWREAQ